MHEMGLYNSGKYIKIVNFFTIILNFLIVNEEVILTAAPMNSEYLLTSINFCKHEIGAYILVL